MTEAGEGGTSVMPKARTSSTTSAASSSTSSAGRQRPPSVRGIEGAERDLWLRPVPVEPDRTDPLIADVDLLNLVDASKLVQERVPLALLADLLAPSAEASERILREERHERMRREEH